MTTTTTTTTTPAALDPTTVQVGDGVTEIHWTDRTPATVVAVRRNGKQIVLRSDKVARRNFTPEITPGGFAGHCHNQHAQYAPDAYDITPDPNGTEAIANWSAKRGAFVIGGPNGTRVRAGRSYYYDYNF